MAVRKLRSKIFLVLLSVVLLVVLAVAALPLWFPWALRPIAKRYGASYANYQRLGYQRFQISNFALTNGPSEIQAQHVTGFVPTAWLWRHLTGERNEQFAVVRSWKYTAVPSAAPHTNAPPSVHKIFGTVHQVAAALRNWLPAATLTDALKLIASSGTLDGAVLDINLQGEMVYPVADALMTRGVAFVFSTGYDGDVIPARYDGYARCEKPISPEQVGQTLFSSMA